MKEEFKFLTDTQRQDFNQTLFDMQEEIQIDAGSCTMIAPMVSIPGNFCLTAERIHFAPVHSKLYENEIFSFDIDKLRMLLLRRYQHADIAIEFVAKRDDEKIEDELQCFGQLTTR